MSETMPDATAPDAPTPDDPMPVPKKRHRVRTIVICAVVVVLVAGVAVWFFAFRNASGQQQQRSFTRVVTVQKGTQTQEVSLTGTLAPRTQADLNFSVSGTVTKVYTKVGDVVQKGQKLAAIDNADLQDAVALAQANLTSANASYTDTVDNSSSTAASIKAAQARVDSSKASLASAQKDLTNAVLRSTISGTVAQVNLTVGDTVGSGSSGGGNSSSSSAQVSVISTSTWKVNATVGSADLGSLKAGQAAAITADGIDQPLKGTVASVGIVASSTSNNGSATFPVVVNVSGKQKDIYSGTNATAVVTTASADNVLTVPTMAITMTNGKTTVDVVKNGQTTPVDVTVGRVFGQNTEITAGLSEGDQVAITVGARIPSGTATAAGSRQGGQGGGITFGGPGGGLGGGGGGGYGGGGAQGGPPAGGPGQIGG